MRPLGAVGLAPQCTSRRPSAGPRRCALPR